MHKKLVVVDISSFIFRAFFAIRPLSAPDGTPVNAVYGILSMLLKLFENERPSHIILARDTKGGTFRNELYSEYKANRGAPPEELVPQFPILEELFDDLDIPELASNEYEADDIIGSVITQFKKEFDEIVIASGDKDLMQFVGDNVRMLDTMKGKLYDRDAVKEKMGVWPEQVVDYLSLVGDSSDNIPGVKGIGAKGAQKLLEEYETLENIFKNKDKITNKRVLSGLENHKEDAELSKKLVTIVTDLDLEYKPDELVYEFKSSEKLTKFLEKYGFNSFIKKLSAFQYNNEQNGELSNATQALKINSLMSQEQWLKHFEQIKKAKKLGIFTYFDDEDYRFEEPRSIALVTEKDHYYISLGLISYHEVVKDILLLNSTIHIFNAKELFAQIHRFDLKREAKIVDLGQAYFLLKPDGKNNLENLAQSYLDYNIQDFDKKSKEYLDEENFFMNKMVWRAKACLDVKEALWDELKKLKLDKIYNDIDYPVIEILTKMELAGIKIDDAFYQKLEKDFTKQVEKIQKTINEMGGEGVNLKSPKQLSKFLFEDLELPVIKKTKTGYSTDSATLTELDAMGVSDIPAEILKFRELEKLLSTYVKVLPLMKNKETGRVHTHLIQNNAATGRLSSDKPNLQNIPIRTENGRMIRKGFIPEEGYVFVGADYSQVELRILAHFSEDPTMIKSFKDNLDIHAQTASEVFGIPLDKVSREERSSAKAINFGLMYGQSSFGLSQTLGISRGEAKDYIEMYFTRFSRVKSYLDSLKELAEDKGYSETLMGRKRFIPGINSTNRQEKSFAERMAINTPIQGAAADIIKKAMIAIDQEIDQFDARMLLQIHDELIFEVKKSEAEKLKKFVVEKMQSAVKLKVPLNVDAHIGDNWYALK